jgi:hypothetical protein
MWNNIGIPIVSQRSLDGGQNVFLLCNGIRVNQMPLHRKEGATPDSAFIINYLILHKLIFCQNACILI